MLLPDQTYEQASREDFLESIDLLKKLLKSNDTNDIKIKRPDSVYTIKDKEKSFNESVDDDCKIIENDIFSESENSDDGEKRGDSPENFQKTSEFFNNIPEFKGEPMGPFKIPEEMEITNTANPDILRECESFLWKYRIRPDFFCRYRRAME